MSGRGTVTVRVRMCVGNGLNYSDTSERINGDTDGEMHCTEKSKWWIQKDTLRGRWMSRRRTG